MKGIPCRIPRARLERDLAAGLTLVQIAAREGYSNETISKHARALGLRIPSRARVTLDDVLAVAAGRETVRDVRDRRGVSRAAVHQAARRAGVRLGPYRPVTSQLDLFREAA